MNRQRFLAELSRLLVYMTEEDRAEAVRRVGALFDGAGPEREADVLAALGTPTRTAIALSRGYEPGKIPDALPVIVPKAPPAAAKEPAEPAPEPDPLWSDLPDFEPPAVEDGEASPAPADEAAPAAAASAPADAPAAEESAPPAAVPAVREEVPSAPPVPAEEPAAEPEGPAVAVERSMPLGLGIPLFVLVFGALGLPLAALLCGLSAALAVPGCGALFGAYLSFVGGLWCTGYMADAALLFGLAAVILALGMLALFLGVWAAVKLWGLYGRGVGWVAGELLGRKVRIDA